MRKYFTTEQTQQVPTNFTKDIINRHTPNHISVARYIKASQEAEKNADNRSTAACTIKGITIYNQMEAKANNLQQDSQKYQSSK